MTLTQLSTIDPIQLVHYLNAQTLAELRVLAKRTYVERYGKYNIAFETAHRLISNLIVQRTTDTATRARMQMYGTSRA